MTPPVVLFSAGLDSAVLLADAVRRFGGAQPVYVRTGLAWEEAELRVAERFLAVMPKTSGIRPLVQLAVGMRDVYPATHWAIRGEAPGFDTPDSDVYLEGRNIVLLSKTAVFAARAGLTTILIGPLAGNPFPDASSQFFDAMTRALALGLGTSLVIEAPFLGLHKPDVIKLGTSLGAPLRLTLSCMQPLLEKHCGGCSKCRERRDAFLAAGFDDPAPYAGIPGR